MRQQFAEKMRKNSQGRIFNKWTIVLSQILFQTLSTTQKSAAMNWAVLVTSIRINMLLACIITVMTFVCADEPIVPPNMVGQLSASRNAEAQVYGETILHCNATGISEPEYVWFFNDAKIDFVNSIRLKQLRDGYSSILELRLVLPDNFGVYVCQVRNRNGVSFNHTITLQQQNSPITITEVNVTEGQSFQLSCDIPGNVTQSSMGAWISHDRVLSVDWRYPYLEDGKVLSYSTFSKLRKTKGTVRFTLSYSFPLAVREYAVVTTNGKIKLFATVARKSTDQDRLFQCIAITDELMKIKPLGPVFKINVLSATSNETFTPVLQYRSPRVINVTASDVNDLSIHCYVACPNPRERRNTAWWQDDHQLSGSCREYTWMVNYRRTLWFPTIRKEYEGIYRCQADCMEKSYYFRLVVRD